MASLPLDVWLHVSAFLRPCDVIELIHVCRDLRDLSFDWDQMLLLAVETAARGISVPRDLMVDGATNDKIVRLARSQAGVTDMTPSRNALFLTVPHVPEAAVEVLARLAGPRLCLVSVDRRAYDTTDFAAKHPGGEHLMLEHSGKDASYVFDAYYHSLHAHHLMRRYMLRFDATAYVGRPGAPSFARNAAPQKWSMARDVSHFADNCLQAALSSSRPHGSSVWALTAMVAGALYHHYAV